MFCWTVELMVCVCAGVCSLGSKQTKLHDMAECLFNTAVPLTVRSSGNTSIPSSYYNNPMYHQSTPFFTTNATPVQFQDESGRRVNSVVVEIYLQTIVANKKLLQLRISDVNDPFFMWQLDLTEEEFFGIRAEQNLLVDFHNFPYKLIELLQKCLAFPASEPSAPFYAQLTVNPAENSSSLAFIERTSFRQVTQLSLKLKSVETEVLKRKLAELMRNYREQISSLQSQIGSANMYTPMSTSSMPAMANTPTNATATATTATPATTGNNKNKVHVHNLATGALVREKDEACAHLNQLYEVTRESKTRLEEENSNLKADLDQLRAQFDESQGEVQKANEIINKLQDEVRGLKAKLKSSASIADDQMNAAEQLRASNKRLQGEYAEMAEKAHTAKIQAETLERDTKTLKTQTEQLEKAIQQRDAIIAHHQRQSNVKDLDRAIRNLDTENTGDLVNTTTNTEQYSFESSGYVGSRIFDQTF